MRASDKIETFCVQIKVNEIFTCRDLPVSNIFILWNSIGHQHIVGEINVGITEFLNGELPIRTGGHDQIHVLRHGWARTDGKIRQLCVTSEPPVIERYNTFVDFASGRSLCKPEIVEVVGILNYGIVRIVKYNPRFTPLLKFVKFLKYYARHRTGGVGRMFQS